MEGARRLLSRRVGHGTGFGRSGRPGWIPAYIELLRSDIYRIGIADLGGWNMQSLAALLRDVTPLGLRTPVELLILIAGAGLVFGSPGVNRDRQLPDQEVNAVRTQLPFWLLRWPIPISSFTTARSYSYLRCSCWRFLPAGHSQESDLPRSM